MRRTFVAIMLLGAVLLSILYFRSAPRRPSQIPSMLSVIQEAPPKIYRQMAHEVPTEQLAHILDGEFSIKTSVDSLSNGLKSAFSRTIGEADFNMADPGHNYQVTDVIEPGLSDRRLVFAGESSERCFLHYETGGRGHVYYVVVFNIDPHKKMTFLWAGAGPGSRNLQGLQASLAAGDFKTADYW